MNNMMTSSRFAPLFWTQFLSAFNDNFLKNTIVFLILFSLAGDAAGSLITLAGAVFMVPFLLLSALGGEIADRCDKAKVAQNLKLAEIAASVVAIGGLAVQSIPVLMAALFLFGVVSALFGPVKYAILPDHLERDQLPTANAWIEAATFIAILGGTIAAGIMSSKGADLTVVGPAILVTAVATWLISRKIPKTGSAAPDLTVDRNVFRSTWRLVNELRGHRRLFQASLMMSWFWLMGAVILSMLPPLVKDALGGTETGVTAYLAVFAIAVGIGSATSAWLSGGRIVLLPAPVGTFLMAIFSLDLAWTTWGVSSSTTATSLAEFIASPNTVRVGLDLAGMAFSGALLVVPTFAAIQDWAADDHRSRIIAAVNVITAGFMVAGGAAVAGLQAAGVPIPALIGGFAVLNAIAAILMFKVLPTRPFQDLLWILFRIFHRLEIEGLENLDKAGKNPVLALNHVSFLDGPLALTLMDEDPIFAIDYSIAQRWWVRPFIMFTRAMPLDPSKPMGTRTLIRAVNDGNPLVIFPEGRITVTGALMKVYDGAAMVADKTDAMVVPVRIDGLEKTFLSKLTREHTRRRLFPKVKVTILEPVKLEVSPELKGRKRRIEAGARLYQAMSDLIFQTTSTDCSVLDAVIATGRDRGMKRLALEDPVTGPMSYGRLLTGVSVLARKFGALFPHEQALGVMLPNANGAIVTLLGVMSAGKVPAMINFTAGATNIVSACTAAEVRTILTSRAFIEQARLGDIIDQVSRSVTVVYLDDIRETIGIAEKVRGLLSKTAPRTRRDADDPAAILFTSGSEGAPKGVVLTHRNILSNAAQAAARIDFHSGDKVFNVLPVFHSFGLTTGTVLPLISGVPIYLYPSPLHYRIVPELIYGSDATIVFGTDTFLNGYARMAHPYDFRSLRYCFAGAEPVKAATRTTYMDKFGLRILEGYGVTETAPIISINTPMFNRPGSVGKILPGMETRLEAVPGVDEGGRLFVRGPNVMAGYLKTENPGVLEPLADGWHDTGDIVSIDGDGFVTICGRAKRFAKIAGEMVSLAAVETLAAELWPGSLCAVATQPDLRKGERLVLVTEAKEATRSDFLAFAKSKGASDLMVPAEIIVDKVPVLGSGKVDFVGVTTMVRDRGAGASQTAA